MANIDPAHDQNRTSARHHWLRNGAIVVGVLGLAFIGWFFWAPISSTADRGITAVVALRNNVNASRPATVDLAPKSEVVKTADGRVFIVETKMRAIDPVAEIDGMKITVDGVKSNLVDIAKVLRDKVDSATEASKKTIADLSATVSELREELKKRPAAPLPVAEVKTKFDVPPPVDRSTAAPAPVSAPQARMNGNVELDLSHFPKNFRVTGYEEGNAAQTCNRAQGRKLVTSANWVWKNGRKFFPNECVSLADPRPAAR